MFCYILDNFNHWHIVTYKLHISKYGNSLSVEQIVEYYGARWKIESGFKELKQEIGSVKTQIRNSFEFLYDGKCIYLDLHKPVSQSSR